MANKSEKISLNETEAAKSISRDQHSLFMFHFKYEEYLDAILQAKNIKPALRFRELMGRLEKDPLLAMRARIKNKRLDLSGVPKEQYPRFVDWLRLSVNKDWVAREPWAQLLCRMPAEKRWDPGTVLSQAVKGREPYADIELDILKALENKYLNLSDLLEAIGRHNSSTAWLNRNYTGPSSRLRKEGLIRYSRKIGGYYRPDYPPSNH